MTVPDPRSISRVRDSKVELEVGYVSVAVAMVHGPRAGLELLATLAGDVRLRGHYRLAAVRAHMHEMAGDADAAIADYLAASRRTASVPASATA